MARRASADGENGPARALRICVILCRMRGCDDWSTLGGSEEGEGIYAALWPAEVGLSPRNRCGSELSKFSAV